MHYLPDHWVKYNVYHKLLATILRIQATGEKKMPHVRIIDPARELCCFYTAVKEQGPLQGVLHPG